tara:strand:+ start:10211 stop:10675 length:465 start_codon:yes stop_codon:yes gene_type:complete
MNKWQDILKAPPLTPEDEKEIADLMRFRNMSRQDAERKVRRTTNKVGRKNQPTYNDYMRSNRMAKMEPKDKSALKIKQFRAMLRMTVGEHGKNSEEVLELGKKFMASNPTEEEIDEVMDYFETLEDKPKPRTPMDELKDRQKQSKKELESKRDR